MTRNAAPRARLNPNTNYFCFLTAPFPQGRAPGEHYLRSMTSWKRPVSRTLDFRPWSDRPGATYNLFEYFLGKSMRIVKVQIEDTKYDDSTLIFKFDGPDPATSPYVNPKAREI
jgi:hypothetical protein